MKPKKMSNLFVQRLAENFLSVKVWLFLIPFILSTTILCWFAKTNIDLVYALLKAQGTEPEVVSNLVSLMNQPYEAFKHWLTFLVSLAGSIIVAREIFKVKKLSALSNGGDKKEIDKVKV